jgi:hypothetical protein
MNAANVMIRKPNQLPTTASAISEPLLRRRPDLGGTKLLFFEAGEILGVVGALSGTGPVGQRTVGAGAVLSQAVNAVGTRLEGIVDGGDAAYTDVRFTRSCRDSRTNRCRCCHRCARRCGHVVLQVFAERVCIQL